MRYEKGVCRDFIDICESMGLGEKVVVLHDSLGVHFREWAVTRDGRMNQLNFESEEMGPDAYSDVVNRLLAALGDTMYMLSIGDPNARYLGIVRRITAVATLECTSRIVEALLERLHIVPVTCLSQIGGVTFDLSDECRPMHVFSVGAWGTARPLLENMAVSLPGVLFENR